jgi:hypothetical protein
MAHRCVRSPKASPEDAGGICAGANTRARNRPRQSRRDAMTTPRAREFRRRNFAFASDTRGLPEEKFLSMHDARGLPEEF